MAAFDNILPHAANFYKRIVMSQCSKPFYVYIETFFPAFIKLALTVALFDLNDTFRSIGEGFVDTDRRGRKGRGRKFRKGKFQEFRNTQQRWQSKGLQTILRVTQPLETIGFRWLLYAAGDRFFYDWQNLIERRNFCTDKVALAQFQRQRIGGRVSILPGGAAISMNILDQQSGDISGNAFGANSIGGDFFASLALSVIGPVGGISGVFLRLRVQVGAIAFNVESEPVDIAENEEIDMVVIDDASTIFAQPITWVWSLVGPAVPVGLVSRGGVIIIGRTKDTFLP